ncbi:MAG: homocysteine S-methyltransferase family protein [Sphingomonadales bacterium]|jgi:5-methyltetrahydrofolate--homocysteine methyltransferase
MIFSNKIQKFKELAKSKILILDGAMGTALQARKLEEADFRGERFKNHSQDLKGDADILNLSAPHILKEIHRDYLEAGADIIETNTFNSTKISQSEYGLEDYAYEISKKGAEIARSACDEFEALDPSKPRFVAGSIGPLNKTLSVSPDINDPAFRGVNFDEVRDAYKEAARGLIEGGADYLLVETIFDTLNAKTAIVAIDELGEELGIKIPISLSLTVTDLSGRTLSGQTVGGFWHSIRHSKPLTVGLNCSFGAQDLRPFISELAKSADTLICAFPNAGLPDELGDYTETPDVTSSELKDWANSGILNVVGGCCGTTPSHINAIAKAMEGILPRDIPSFKPALRLSGLEPQTIFN